MGFNSDPNAGGLFTFTAVASGDPNSSGSAPSPAAYVRAYMGDEGLVLPFAEGSSQVFLRGDLVKLSSGKVVAATYSSHVVSNQTLLGIAQRNATGTADSRIDVRVFRPDDVWLINYDSGLTFVVGDVSSKHALKSTVSGTEASVGAGGVFVVDTSTTDPIVVIIASNEYKSPGTGLSNALPNSSGALLNANAGGRLYVKFLESRIEWSATE